ncbi:MAG: NAD(P)/FAD-dependent oxidoreductase [Deltaproteobacteria bacterium]|nr:NAD(P)/FAD-dependent oxidoreductase [Deltaproteobacteria bacterium]
MAEQSFKYIIVGGGLAGASAIQGIREVDTKGPILLIGAEKHLPYDRPPLTKKLWFGKKKVEDIFLQKKDFYDNNGVTLLLGTNAVELDATHKTVTDENGETYRYEKLLIATGGLPRSLPIAGGDLEGLCYYRTLDDYENIRKQAVEGASAIIIGGGFIGSEIAAALNMNKIDVTMIYPSSYLVNKVFPEQLGVALQKHFMEKGIRIFAKSKPELITAGHHRFITKIENGPAIESDMVIVGVGISPVLDLARTAGLDTGNGIVVNEFLQTSNPDIYAAGDNAFFPYQALGIKTRVEHWDNALTQGKYAGRNMAGEKESYTHMPYFFSDLFEFGYEAVGEVNSELDIFCDWQKENDTGVIYYMRDKKVRGVMLCNIWEKVEVAREMIKSGKKYKHKDLRDAIR